MIIVGLQLWEVEQEEAQEAAVTRTTRSSAKSHGRSGNQTRIRACGIETPQAYQDKKTFFDILRQTDLHTKVTKSMQNFKKMQKSALKICIYEIKAVLLHRQKQNGEADNRQDAAFFIVLV